MNQVSSGIWALRWYSQGGTQFQVWCGEFFGWCPTNQYCSENYPRKHVQRHLLRKAQKQMFRERQQTHEPARKEHHQCDAAGNLQSQSTAEPTTTETNAGQQRVPSCTASQTNEGTTRGLESK